MIQMKTIKVIAWLLCLSVGFVACGGKRVEETAPVELNEPAGEAAVEVIEVEEETAVSPPTSADPAPTSIDACALLPATAIQQTLDISADISASPDNGTFVGDFAGVCGYVWEDGASRISFSIQPDPEGEQFNQLLGMATEGGLVESVEGLGVSAIKRLDGSLLWSANDDMIYTLSGSQNEGSSLMDIGILSQLAQMTLGQ